jgi:hypothetical protein
MAVRYAWRMEDIWQRWKQSAALRLVALLVLLVSPVGAPIIGIFIVSECHLAAEGESDCIVPEVLIDYFIGFPIAAAMHLGTLLSIVWLLLSLAVLICCLFCAAQAVWQAVTDRA